MDNVQNQFEEHNAKETEKLMSQYEKTKNPFDLLSEDFDGVILSKKLIEKLDLKTHPFLTAHFANELSDKGEVISTQMAACVIHKDGWGYTSF